jgi:hypothetical protein
MFLLSELIVASQKLFCATELVSYHLHIKLNIVLSLVHVLSSPIRFRFVSY